VISNLLTNAAKFTDPGGLIDVVAARVENEVQIVVTANGRGISADVLPWVFDLFSQERQAIDRSEVGLGLGLAIVRSRVLAHGGSVQAHSDGKGRGARFTITLPLHLQPQPDVRTAAAASAASPDAMRILVVDDNADAAEMLAESLRTLGHSTEMALRSRSMPR
jgi:CheY-like chemotaxis protein